jgi:uncharacterized iron-regulated membrane protein
MNRLTRLLHRWGSLLIALPLLVVILTGVLLQIKKQVPWVQPPTARGSAESPTLGWDQILEIARRVPEADVENWSDIDRLDVRIDRGLVKVQCKNRWELQIDLANGDVLASTYRRSDAIEAMHDGSWFGGDRVKLGLFLPAAVVLLGLWLTGLYLFALPIVKRRLNRRKRRERQTTS